MRTLKRLGSLTALVVLGSILTLAAGQQIPTFTPEQEARLRIREVMDGPSTSFRGSTVASRVETWPSG